MLSDTRQSTPKIALEIMYNIPSTHILILREGPFNRSRDAQVRIDTGKPSHIKYRYNISKEAMQELRHQLQEGDRCVKTFSDSQAAIKYLQKYKISSYLDAETISELNTKATRVDSLLASKFFLFLTPQQWQWPEPFDALCKTQS